MRKNWTDNENAAICRLYFDMLACAINGRKYTKAAMIRNAQANALADRSRGSIEAKLMNCSAIHAAIDPSAVTMNGHGYRALSNYQGKLFDRMRYELVERYELQRESA